VALLLLPLLPLLIQAAANSASPAAYAAARFELGGRVRLPESVRGRTATIRLRGETLPYLKHVAVLHNGHYRFKRLRPGSYAIAAYVEGYGIYDRDIEIGPSEADPQGHVEIDLPLDEVPGHPLPPGANAFISARELSIPDKALDEYSRAFDAFGKNDEAAGIEHLERAVAIAPQYSEALNTLGTVYYHRHDYSRAEAYFRASLRQDPEQFEAQVNLGGTLLGMGRYQEALEYNSNAEKMRPRDPLVFTQLGWNYLKLNQLHVAEHYFQEAVLAAPDHFSRPQLGLAATYASLGDSAREAAQLQQYIQRHPDDVDVPHFRQRLQQLQAEKRTRKDTEEH